MKTTCIITAICMLLLSVACQSSGESMHTQHVSVLIDRTGVVTKPTAVQILHHLDTKKVFDGFAIRLKNITDNAFTSSENFHIEASQGGLLSNEDQRRRRIKGLKQKFTQALEISNERSYDFKQSVIFEVLVKELRNLAQHKNAGTILLYSDLQECSPLFNSYSQAYQLHVNPKQVQKRFEQHLNDTEQFNDIDLHIIYQPKTAHEASLFSDLVHLYRMLLEPKGVHIHVGIQHTTHF